MVWRALTPFTGRIVTQGGDMFNQLHRELNRAFDDVWTGHLANVAAPASVLRLDVKEDDKAFTVTADMPGLDGRDVDVTFNEGQLTIRGEKKVERDEKKDTWHVTERSYGSFARQLSIPTNIDSDKIEAKFENGVLNITLPKMPNEQAKSRKIEVK